jgi:type VI secretion system protein ImpK
MTMDSDHPQAAKTVVLDRDGVGPAQGALTDFPSPPRFEQLQERMIHTARVQGLQGFDNASNPLVAAA